MRCALHDIFPFFLFQLRCQIAVTGIHVSSFTHHVYTLVFPLKTLCPIRYRNYGIESRSTNQTCPFQNSH
jgi:hypothetical protein